MNHMKDNYTKYRAWDESSKNDYRDTSTKTPGQVSHSMNEKDFESLEVNKPRSVMNTFKANQMSASRPTSNQMMIIKSGFQNYPQLVSMKLDVPMTNPYEAADIVVE